MAHSDTRSSDFGIAQECSGLLRRDSKGISHTDRGCIVNVLAGRFTSFPRMKTEKIGYGAGARDFKDFPNVLRLTVGESSAEHKVLAPEETITILEANVDDMTPQVFGYVMERVLQEERWMCCHRSADEEEPAAMLLTVLCYPEDGSG